MEEGGRVLRGKRRRGEGRGGESGEEEAVGLLKAVQGRLEEFVAFHLAEFLVVFLFLNE